MITAHSGCDQTRDNSIEFLDYAFGTDADCLEVDVRTGQNGELILSHDETEAEAVTLREAFEKLRQFPEKKMNCDLKQENLELAVYRLAAESGVQNQLIYSGEVSLWAVHNRKAKLPGAEIFFNIENLMPDIYQGAMDEDKKERLLQAIRLAAGEGISFLNIEYHCAAEEILKAMEQEHIRASVWTVQEDLELARLISRAENVTTRNVKRALEIRKELKR